MYFSYERFTDHMVVGALLDRHLNTADPASSFNRDTPLGRLLVDEHSCWTHRGLIDALSVQIPERVGKELVEVAPDCKGFRPIVESFIQSIVWRDPKSVSSGTLTYINDHVVRHRDTDDKFLDALLTVAGDPEHPYNAEFLHDNLLRIKMPARDQWWSVFIHNQYGEHGAVDRLLDWASSDQTKNRISDKAVLLSGVALAWFLTSSNRYLRDRATKALVSLLTPRIQLVRKCLKLFLEVDDAYVVE